MINLIPPSAKRSLLIEYWVRVMSSWLIIWSVALFASASILYPAYVLIGSQVSANEVSADEASEKVASFENVSTSLERASLQARAIVNQLSTPVFSEYIKLFESLQGTGIQLKKIELSREDAGVAPVTLVGVANNRQSLASFRDRLLAEEEVVSVDLPISNLASDKDIQFTITVTLNNSQNEV